MAEPAPDGPFRKAYGETERGRLDLEGVVPRRHAAKEHEVKPERHPHPAEVHGLRVLEEGAVKGEGDWVGRGHGGRW